MKTEKTVEKTQTYTVRGLWDIARLHLEPPAELWNGIRLENGSVVELIGQPGIGKSRLAGDLGRHQILGRDFGGRPTCKKDIKWLFIGSENNIHRLNRESNAFLFHEPPSSLDGKTEDELRILASQNGFSSTDLDLLEKNFRAMTLESAEDFDISLANPKNVEKLTATLKIEKPNVLVVDPWGDCISGNELDDGDVRKTIRTLRNCISKAGLKETLIIIINHARMGAAEEARAFGSEAGNFGKNSKCLYSIARYVINIRRASFENNGAIELICAKDNNGTQKESIALDLNPVSMSYTHNASFDAAAWQSQLNDAAGIRGPHKTNPLADTKKALSFVKSILSKANDGTLIRKELQQALISQYGMGKTAAENFISASVNSTHDLATTPKMKENKDGSWGRDGSKILYGLPEDIKAYQESHH